MKKKILIVSALFYPDITPRAFRATELAKGLKNQGHDVVVYIPFKGRDYINFQKETGIIIKDLGKLFFKDIKIRKNIIGNILTRGIRKILLILFEYPNIELTFRIKQALKNEANYDLLVSNAWPHPVHWGVALARKKNHKIAKVWIADCGDPYYRDKNSGYKRLFYFKYIEKWFCKKTDYISIPRIEMKKNYFKEFHYKIKEIPQGFNFNGIKICNNEFKNEIPTFAFSGIFIPKMRDPAPLLEYLSIIDLNFKFIVYTDNCDLLQPYFNILGEKLIVSKFIPRHELLYELSKMDFLINISFDPINQSPSKLIDYTLSGRPILNISSELDTELIEEFLRKDYHQQFIIDDIQKYNIENVVRQFIALTD